MKNRYRKLTAISIIVTIFIFAFGCSNPSSSENENKLTHYNRTDVYDMVIDGAHIILAYESSIRTFQGTITNESGGVLNNVSIEIHLSSGITIGPFAPKVIDIDETLNFSLFTSDDSFTTWAVIVKVG